MEDAIKRTLAEGKLTPKVIIPVDLFGLPADYPAIEKIANKGQLDAKGSDFSYNEKAATDNFINSAKEMAEKDSTFKENASEFLKKSWRKRVFKPN